MALARRLLLRASRSARLARALQRRPFFRRAVRRFLPGEDLDAALDAATALGRGGLGSVLTQLGEQVTSAADAGRVRDHYLDALERVRCRGLDAHLSVKLTHLGVEHDRAACRSAVAALAARAAGGGSLLWVDMEESRYVDVTVGLVRDVRASGTPLGVCLQAYLRRAPADLEALLAAGLAIRLVKGAYNEPAAMAFPRKRDVDAAYVQLASRLLTHAARGGPRPVFGTHDPKIITRIQDEADTLGVRPEAYEVHMLYGIRSNDQRSLARAGARVRVLISYGSAWFPWYMRRLAERPANVWFVLKNLW